MELTLDVVERLIAHSQQDLSRAAEYRFVHTPEELRAHDYSEMNQVLLASWISSKRVTNPLKHVFMPGDVYLRAFFIRS